ncbi:MAG: gluconokinase, GntK/IdnK-type [Acidimicrobiales bacterium]|nr:gluconokinase, GntK/IdnK-type [Acidimicrobiales bacterium]
MNPDEVVVVMGVSGAGKTTIGRELASRTGARFVEGDRLHPPENVERMASGVALDDRTRAPWLDALAGEIAAAHERGEATVIAASVLRRAYRDRLRAAGPVTFVLLLVEPDELVRRLDERDHEFMPPGLLDDQLATLEPPGADEPDVVVVAPTGGIDSTVDAVRDALGSG